MKVKLLCIADSVSDLDALRWCFTGDQTFEHPVGIALLGNQRIPGMVQTYDIAVAIAHSMVSLERVVQFLRLVQAATPWCRMLILSPIHLHEEQLCRLDETRLMVVSGLRKIDSMLSVAEYVLSACQDNYEHVDDVLIDRLSGRERQILSLFSNGYTTKEIAYELGISVSTVATHRKSLYRKTQVNSIQHLMLLASRINRQNPIVKSKIGLFYRSGEGNDVADVLHSGNVLHSSFKAESEPCMWNTAESP